MSWLEVARSSLRGRLALGLVAGTIAALSISFFALHLIIRDEIYAHLDEDLLLRMGAVANYAMAHPGAESIGPFMPRFRSGAHEDVFQVWDGHRRTLARSASTTRDLPYLDAVAGSPTYASVVLPDGHSGRAVVQKYMLPVGDPRVALTVLTAEETENFQGLENRIHGMLMLGALMTIIALVMITAYSIQAGLRPVDEFARSLERVNPDRPNERLDAGPLPTELRPVAASFSALLDRLLDALSREKRYARNVAHELRNPLAEIRLLVDVGSSRNDLAALRTAMRDIGATASEMEQTVESLLALTRYEAGLESPQPEPVEICAELRRQVGALATQSQIKNLKLDLQLPDEFWVHADSALLRRLLANLLGNAITHTPPGSEVQLQMNADGEIRLVNPAPQLVAGDIPRLGERFFRIGSDDGAAHAGLGLSLAGAMAKVLGLRLELGLRDDGRLVVTISGFEPLSQLIAAGGAASAAETPGATWPRH
jgi:two-component system sensor histidine kinase QseC